MPLAALKYYDQAKYLSEAKFSEILSHLVKPDRHLGKNKQWKTLKPQQWNDFTDDKCLHNITPILLKMKLNGANQADPDNNEADSKRLPVTMVTTNILTEMFVQTV